MEDNRTMSINPFPKLNMKCPRCQQEFIFDTLRDTMSPNIKTECPKCKLPFINTNYVRYHGQPGMYISDWGINIWAKECKDGEWRIPEGKYFFDEEEAKRWNLKKNDKN